MTEHVIGLDIPVCLILPPLFYPEDDLVDDIDYYCLYLVTHMSSNLKAKLQVLKIFTIDIKTAKHTQLVKTIFVLNLTIMLELGGKKTSVVTSLNAKEVPNTFLARQINLKGP